MNTTPATNNTALTPRVKAGLFVNSSNLDTSLDGGVGNIADMMLLLVQSS